MSYVNVQGRRNPFIIRYLSELITFRHLCWNLVGSDLRSRFRRSRLGILWAVIQPLGFALMIGAVWGAMLHVPDYWTFTLYVFTGMLLWEYFANCVIGSQDSLLVAEGYLRQTRIPLVIFQIRTALTGMFVLCCGILGLFVLEAALGKLPPLGMHLLLVPAYLGLYLLFALPLNIVMSLMGAQFRDLRHISQLVVQGLFFISPIMLQRNILEAPELSFLQYANPMVPFLDMFRAPVLDGKFWKELDLYIVLLWITGLWVVAAIMSARAGRRIVFAL